MKLYHYVHCPFCIRVRMALGFLNINYTSQVLRYDDEPTPISLTNKKMLPIFEFSPKNIINESLDIIKLLDENDKLQTTEVIKGYSSTEIVLNSLGEDVHSLAMPYWIWTPEFDDKSRSYFQNKKESKRGPFYKLVENKEINRQSLNTKLSELENDLIPFYKSNKFTLNDILLASHLWGLYVVPEYQLSHKLHLYLQGIKKLCNFDYHEDFWRKSGS